MAQFNYNEQSKSSGIYVIFNSYNWRIYVGSCKEFKARWRAGHYGSLKNNKHSNKFLQSDFNKCRELLGHDDFLEFHVLENMPNSTRKDRLMREETWIKVHFDNGKNCYNLCDRAISREGHESKNPEETGKNLSLALKRFYTNPLNRENQSRLLLGKPKPPRSEIHKENMRVAKLGTKHSVETREKMSLAHKTEKNLLILKETYEQNKLHIQEKQREAVSKKHILVQPDGHTIEVVNLNKFCKENGLHSSGFSNLTRLNRNKYKGWRYLGSSSAQNKGN